MNRPGNKDLWTIGFTAAYGLVVLPFTVGFVGDFAEGIRYGSSPVLAALFGWALPVLLFALQAVSARLAVGFWKTRTVGTLVLFAACQSLTIASVYHQARKEAWNDARFYLADPDRPDRKERERLEKVARSLDGIMEGLVKEDDEIRRDRTLTPSQRDTAFSDNRGKYAVFKRAAENARQGAAEITLAFARDPGGKPTDVDRSLSGFMRRTALTAPALFALLFALVLPTALFAFARAMVDKPTRKHPSAALDLRAEFAAGEALPPDAQPAFVDGLRPILASHLLSLWATKRAAAQTTYLHVEQQHELSILEEWADLRRRILESGLTGEARARLAAHADSVLTERLDSQETSPE